jgi:hypothetical protein
MYITLRSKIKYYIEKYGERPLGARRNGRSSKDFFYIPESGAHRNMEGNTNNHTSSALLNIKEILRAPYDRSGFLKFAVACEGEIIFSDTINGFKYFIKGKYLDFSKHRKR